MTSSPRARRLAKRIGEIVATAIDREIKDPRLQYVTITDVRLTGDLHDATVYYTVRGETLDATPNVNAAAAALNKAKGQLRTLVGQRTGVRFTPTLRFEADTVPDAALHMEELLAQARAADAATAKAREGASPAGEANPYQDNEDAESDVAYRVQGILPQKGDE